MATADAALTEALLSLGSQTAAAKKLKISRSHVSLLLAGKRRPSDALLKKLGLRRIESYVKPLEKA